MGDIFSSFFGGQAAGRAPMRKEGRDMGVGLRLTLEAMHSFPQRTVLTEDILATQNPGDEHYAAQRTIACIRHQGEGFFGPPTGKTVWVRTWADRICAEGAVRQEWLLQDRAAIVAQLGLNVQEFARNLGVMQNQLGIARESAENARRPLGGWAGR